jgi:hypothetical protein
VTISTLQLAGSGYALDSTVTTCAANGTVAARSSCIIGVTLTPAATGSQPGTLSVVTSANTLPVVKLSGTGQ